MSFSPLSISRGASASSCCLLIDDVDRHLVPTFVTALNAVSDEDEGRASPSHAGRMFLRATGTIPCCIPRANTWLCDAIALLAKSIVSVARLRVVATTRICNGLFIAKSEPSESPCTKIS